MAGLNIFYGDSKSEAIIKEKLETYDNTRQLDLDGNHFELRDNVSSFLNRPTGGISLIYKYDERVSNSYRDHTDYILRTRTMGMRIIQSDKTIFLVELPAPRYYKAALHQISKLLYEKARGIKPAIIPSDLVKSIESLDSRLLHGEWYKGVNAKDRSVGAFGVLDERLGNGTHSGSDIHESLKTKEKTYTSFDSLSTGFKVFISAKKSSIALTGENADHNETERYFRHFLMPHIVTENETDDDDDDEENEELAE